MILSTVSPETIAWAAEVARPHGIAVLECGVTGGGKVVAGEIAAMVGGDAEAFALARPYLEAFAAPVAHVGALGAGMKAKLARNLIVFGTHHVVAEAARLAVAAGVDLEQLVEISDAGDRYSGGPTMMLKHGISPTEPPSDATDLALRQSMATYVHKDVGAALALAAELHINLPVSELVLERCEIELGLE